MSAEQADTILLHPEQTDARAIDLSSARLLSQVEIIGEREGGMIDCWVPSRLIDYEEVPVKEEWAEDLAAQMRDMAAADGGTGQLTPIVLGMIEGEQTFKIMDGFHREAALRINGIDMVYATVKQTDWDGLYNVRIATAKDHAHVRFSRVVQWIREVWEYSGLSEKISVQQAILLTRFDSSGLKLGLEPEDAEAAKAWVTLKEKQWNIKAMTIHSYLTIAENVDPKLVHSTREKKSGKVLEAPTQAILTIFSDEIPKKFALQNLVMEAAMLNNLKGPEVKALCLSVRNYDNFEKAKIFVSQINWKTWQPVFSDTTKRALRRANDPRHKGATVLDNAGRDIANITDRVETSLARREEVTAEMHAKIEEAHKRATAVAAELGYLIGKLDELKELRPVPVESTVPPPLIARSPSRRQGLTVSSPVVISETAEVVTDKRSTNGNGHINHDANFEPASLSTLTAAIKALETAPNISIDEYTEAIQKFLDGKATTVPHISKRRHIIAAEKLLDNGTFTGNPSLQDQLRVSIARARDSLSQQFTPLVSSVRSPKPKTS
jgi:hypothetical protein